MLFILCCFAFFFFISMKCENRVGNRYLIFENLTNFKVKIHSLFFFSQCSQKYKPLQSKKSICRNQKKNT